MSLKTLPYETQVLLPHVDWREDFVWPVNYLDTRQNSIDIALLIHEYIGTVDDIDFKNALIMLMHRIVPLAIWKMEALHTHQNAKSMGFQLDHVTPELKFLFGEENATPQSELASRIVTNRSSGSELRLFLQRVKWTYLWSGAMKTATSFYRSREKVISTGGGLLTREMKIRNLRPALHLGTEILNSARNKYGSTVKLPDDWVERSDELISKFADVTSFEGEARKRYRKSLSHDMQIMLAVCANDLAALRQVKRLPTTVWSGTGSKHAVRAIGLEVMRRGGDVVRFTHGGTHGVVRSFGQVASLELAVSTELVASSKMQADLISTSGEVELAHQYNPNVLISSGSGEPNITGLSDVIPKRQNRSKIRVIYVLSPLVRFVAKPASKILNNVLYLEFNYHVLETLKDMPFDVICKPHPEGMLPGASHPLSDLNVPGNTPYEEVVSDADVIVVDNPFSTAFWQIMGTDRGVVYIDTGISEFHPKVLDKVRERCQFVSSFIDDRGRFRVDFESLEEAVSAAATQNVDPCSFQELHS